MRSFAKASAASQYRHVQTVTVTELRKLMRSRGTIASTRLFDPSRIPESLRVGEGQWTDEHMDYCAFKHGTPPPISFYEEKLWLFLDRLLHGERVLPSVREQVRSLVKVLPWSQPGQPQQSDTWWTQMHRRIARAVIAETKTRRTRVEVMSRLERY